MVVEAAGTVAEQGVDRDGDFEVFVDVQAPQLLRLARALTGGNEHDAWDLTQETLTRVGMRWRRLRAENPAGYARTVLIRLNVDRLRRLRRERPTPDAPEIAGPEPSTPGIASWLYQGLQSLSAKQRTVLALRFAEDMDIATIARSMSCSEGTVKSHLSRGLQRLRQYERASRTENL